MVKKSGMSSDQVNLIEYRHCAQSDIVADRAQEYPNTKRGGERDSLAATEQQKKK